MLMSLICKYIDQYAVFSGQDSSRFKARGGQRQFSAAEKMENKRWTCQNHQRHPARVDHKNKKVIFLLHRFHSLLLPFPSHIDRRRHQPTQTPQHEKQLDVWQEAMLRIIKQKALGQEEQLTQNQQPPQQPQQPQQQMANIESSQKKLVSHVPISVGSRTEAQSTSSSISSKDEESVADMQSNENSKQTNVKRTGNNDSSAANSRSESSGFVGTAQIVSPSPRPVTFLVPPSTSAIDHVKNNNVRKISQDGGASQAFSYAPPAKRARQDIGYTIESPAYPNAGAAPKPAMSLLACKDDEAVLNPLHVLVRNQIEVFTATSKELAQPAPGRKQPIKLHQVGLRCIHCRHLPNRKRVKRAVCYPTSVGRVYHSVSDMKFDHFSNCKEIPEDIRTRLKELKAAGKRSTGEKKTINKAFSSSTAQYYHDTAVQMGMVDGPGGIFMATAQAAPIVRLPQQQAPLPVPVTAMMHPLPQVHAFAAAHQDFNLASLSSMQSVLISRLANSQVLMSVSKTSLPHLPGAGAGVDILTNNSSSSSNSMEKQMMTATTRTMRLAEDKDTKHLNPLHCFVRRHVEIFTANKQDIDAPSPGRKTKVMLGQVGIRCVHCKNLPIKQRGKRAVCYPPTVSGIYHSVSNMKFDHFGICKGLPEAAREEFQALKSSCSRHGTAGNNIGSRGSSSSTAQYYHDSAIRKGLVDSDIGIRIKGSVTTAAVAGTNATLLNVKKTNNNSSAPKRMHPTGLSALVMAASQAA